MNLRASLWDFCKGLGFTVGGYCHCTLWRSFKGGGGGLFSTFEGSLRVSLQGAVRGGGGFRSPGMFWLSKARGMLWVRALLTGFGGFV